MRGKDSGDLPGLTAQEIRDSHFSNELAEDGHTGLVVGASNYLIKKGFDVWEYRSTVSGKTAWRDALDKFWLVDHEADDIASWNL